MAEAPSGAPPQTPQDGGVKGKLHRLDEYQQERARLAFPVAVVKKFGDDKAGKLAALIAYYGFFSLFPLLLLFVTVLGFVLGDNQELRDDVVNSVLGRFPIIGEQLKVGDLRGSGLALVIGLAGALWGGLAVMQAAQDAMNEIWAVPQKDRPNFLTSRLRSGVMLVVLGVGMVAATLLAGVATAGGGSSLPVQVGSLAVSAVVNLGLYLAAFRLLTVRDISLRELVPGAALAAVASLALQAAGGYLIGHRLGSASQTYGTFATVIVLLSWLALQAQVTLFAAEINVVRARGLWPRSLLREPLVEADKQVLTDVVKVEERVPEQEVRVRFDQRPSETGAGAADDGTGPTAEAVRSDAPPAAPPPAADADDRSFDRREAPSFTAEPEPDDGQAPARRAAPRRPVKAATTAGRGSPGTTKAAGRPAKAASRSAKAGGRAKASSPPAGKSGARAAKAAARTTKTTSGRTSSARARKAGHTGSAPPRRRTT